MKAEQNEGKAGGGPASNGVAVAVNDPGSSVAEETTYRLRHLILERALRPGDRLPSERELTALLKASRTSVRTALKQLEAAGVLIVSARRGAFVNDGSPAAVTASIRSLVEMQRITLTQLIDFRRAVEPATAATAARLRDQKDIADLGAQIEAMRRAANDGDLSAYSAADQAFHARIALASRNPLFGIVLESVGDTIQVYRLATNRLGRPLIVRSFADHSAIFDAISAGDQEAAAAAMIRHIVDSAVTFRLVSPEEVT